MLLFLIQCIRKVSHFWLLKWIMKLHPVFDAYFAPLKHKHQYWSGVLLLARVVVLATFVSTFNIPDSVNVFILSILGTALLLFMSLLWPYKNTAMYILHSSFIANLIFLSLSITFIIMAFCKTDNNLMNTVDKKTSPKMKTAAIMISTGVAFLQFCGIVLYPVLFSPLCSSANRRCCPHEKVEVKMDSDDYSIANSYATAGYRDSILNESQPLLPTY